MVLFGHVADDLDVLQLADAVVLGKGDGEEEFIVLAAVQRAGGYVHVQLLGHDGGLIVEGDALLVDAAAGVALGADVRQLAAQPVADVHHAGGAYARLAQTFDDVAACLGFQLAFQDIFLAREVGLEIDAVGVVAGFLGLVPLLVINGFLAFQELEAHIGGTQVAADADEVRGLGAVAVDDVLLSRFAQYGDADGHACEAAGGVSANEVHAVLFTSQAHAVVQRFDVLDAESFA